MTALRQCQHLVIGITQYDVQALADSPAAHRSPGQSNPMTYNERQQAITRMLLAENVPTDRFSFAPFPIEQPTKLADFIGAGILCFTTMMEPWNAEKIQRLKDNGFPVVVFSHRSVKRYEGSTIRRQIADGDDAWKASCHQAVVAYLEQSGLVDRIRAA